MFICCTICSFRWWILSWTYPQPHALRCSSMTSLVTASDTPRCTFSSVASSLGHIPSEVRLLQHRYFGCPAPTFTHWSESVQLKLSPEFQPVQYGSTEAAAMSWPSASSGCYQNVSKHSRDDKQHSSTASSQSRKQPLMSTRLWYTVRLASLVARTEACPLIAKQQEQLQIQSSTF